MTDRPAPTPCPHTNHHFIRLYPDIFSPELCTVMAALPYRYLIPHFLSVTLPKLAEYGEPDKIRVVYWFDN